MGDSVRVAVRVRPFNQREKDRQATLIIDMIGVQTIITNPENKEEKKFSFDFSYWSHDGFTMNSDGLAIPDGDKYADQQKVFDTVGMDVLTNAYKGFNCSLFAYGQTGSGKSYSMVGYGANKGIVPIVTNVIFENITEKQDDKHKFMVQLSMLEIYNEQVRDLLSKEPTEKGGLKVRQHPKLGVQVVGLSEVAVNSYAEIEKRIDGGTNNRTVAATQMNATSSRAHTVVAIIYKQIEVDAKGPGKDKETISKINLVDLAGSERAESTGATGDRLKEGAAINLSLTMLGNVIKALAEKSNNPNSKILIPYRDSKLTQILQDALGGNSKTIMIAALSPADINYEETLSTLRYADRAKQIKNKAIVNVDPTEALIGNLKAENAKLMAQLKALTEGGNFDPSLFGGGDGGGGGGGGGKMSEEEIEAMKKKIQEDMAAELAANQALMQEQAKSWEQKLAEAKKEFSEDDKKKAEEDKKKKSTPHMINVNEDPALSNMVVKFFEEGTTVVGKQGSQPAPTIALGGLSIVKNHATFENKGGKVTMVIAKDAKMMVNGKQPDADHPLGLVHNDRLMFGANHLYIFRNPHDGKEDAETTWDEAQDEIARGQGFATETKSLAHLTQAERDHMLIQDEIVRMVPLVAEANSIAEELEKPVTFEVKLVNKTLPSGKFKTEVAVIVKNPSTSQSWMWPAPKFMNRVYLFRELYQTFAQEGMAAVKAVPQDQDPFWEPEEPVLIGNGYAYLSPLAYGIEFEGQVQIRDYKAKDEGILNMTVHPMTKEAADPADAAFEIDDPQDLIGKPMFVRVHIESGRGFNPKFVKGLHVRFRWGENPDSPEIVGPVIKGTTNPDWKWTHVIKVPAVDKSLINYFENSALSVAVYGDQDPKAGAQVARATGGGKKAGAAGEAQAMQVEFEQATLALEKKLATAKGEANTVKFRLNRILGNNNEATKMLAEWQTAGVINADQFQKMAKLIKPGGASKFKAAAKLVAATASQKNTAGGGAGAKDSKACTIA